jgi:hypothetical protein
MVRSRHDRSFFLLVSVLAFAFLTQTSFGKDPSETPENVSDLKECSIAKTNTSCVLTIDWDQPPAPATIQMFPGAKLTVRMKNAYFFKRHFMDYSSGQLMLAPDIASNIATGLMPCVKNLNEFLIVVPSYEAGGEPNCSASIPLEAGLCGLCSRTVNFVERPDV